MGGYASIESWASRLGYVVEESDGGYIWHPSDDLVPRRCQTAREAMEEILGCIRSEYKGAE
jgi:hypothetical protein